MNGADDGIFAIGDCTATSYAPTAQVASQQGAYLARLFNQIAKRDNLQNRLDELEKDEARVTNEDKARVAEEVASIRKHLAKVKLRPFHYSHQGSLACVFRRGWYRSVVNTLPNRYIGSEKAIAELPFMNGTVSH